MSQIKTPHFLQDLVRDLRDRRLLLPAVALIVALIAVPVLLAGSSEPAPAAPAPAAAPEGAEAVAPAVLAEQGGIRDYRKRLDALAKKDPFAQKFAAPKASDVAVEESVATTGTSATPETGTGTGTPSLDDALAQATGSSSPSGVTSSEPTTVTEPQTGTTDSGDAGQRKPEVHLVVGRVDVAFGPADDAKEIEGVRQLDFLPDSRDPIVSFIGLAGNGDHAVFGLAPSVVDTRGDGSCAPKKPDPCQFVRLGEGQVRYLKTDSDKTYKLKLIETHFVRVSTGDGD